MRNLLLPILTLMLTIGCEDKHDDDGDEWEEEALSLIHI